MSGLKRSDVIAVFALTIFGAFLINGARVYGAAAFVLVVAAYASYRFTPDWPVVLRAITVGLTLFVPIVGIPLLLGVTFWRHRRSQLRAAESSSM